MGDIFPGYNAPDLFGHAPPPDPLIGAVICMSEPCHNCGTNVAVVCAARGSHTAGLKCRNCDAQWTADINLQILRAVVAEIASHFGATAEIKLTTIKQRREAMTEYDNTNRGVLFRNEEKENPKHADFKGTINVNGEEFWLNAWINESKKGTKYMALRLTPKQEIAESFGSKKAKPEFDDQIPW
jgi:hypothetical protein